MIEFWNYYPFDSIASRMSSKHQMCKCLNCVECGNSGMGVGFDSRPTHAKQKENLNYATTNFVCKGNSWHKQHDTSHKHYTLVWSFSVIQLTIHAFHTTCRHEASVKDIEYWDVKKAVHLFNNWNKEEREKKENKRFSDSNHNLICDEPNRDKLPLYTGLGFLMTLPNQLLRAWYISNIKTGKCKRNIIII